MKSDLRPIVKRMNDLFITERKKYIIQKEDGTYSWLSVTKENNVRNFQDYMIEYHLKRKRTYGIFSGNIFTKFITFDVDIISHELVQSIYKELNHIGIESKYIHTSWSGSKGHHVDIYFPDTITISSIKKLYDYIIFKLHRQFPTKEVHKTVELRPGPTQGLKLPLGVNHKNKDTNKNICWYVDAPNSLIPIKNLEYILKIEQIDKSTILNIINELPLTPLNQKTTKPTQCNKVTKSSHADLEIYHKNTTINSLKILDENGLSRPGTRNESLCKLAIYYKELELSKKQCEDRLIQWMNRQDTHFYKTSLKICYEEIKRIVHGVYSKNIPLRYGKTKIEVSRNELLNLYQFRRIERMTLYYLLIHSKRYEDDNGDFFMTYNQLMEAGNYSKTTAINHVKSLEEHNAIEVIRSPIHFSDNSEPRNLPNKYKLNFGLKFTEDKHNNSVVKTIQSIKDYDSIANEIIRELFTNLEWAHLHYRTSKIIVE